MGIFSRTTASERDQNTIIQLERDVQDLRREMDAAQRRIDAVDLHARAIVEEAKRLINKFERRLDRETPPEQAGKGLQDAPSSTNPRAVAYDRPYTAPRGPNGARRHY